MKKQISITLAAIMLAGLTACGTSTPAASSEATAPVSSESEATAEEPSADSELDATVDEAEQALSDIGSIDVDKGLFDVTITFPADFATDITQEEIDQQVADGKVAQRSDQRGWQRHLCDEQRPAQGYRGRYLRIHPVHAGWYGRNRGLSQLYSH